MRIARHVFLIALLVPVVGASAQSSTSRWAPWIGCWQPVNAGASGSTTCVVPGADAATAEILVMAGDSVMQQSTIIADGTERTIDAEGCVGTESARFSDDGARVYMSGEVRCADGPVQVTSGVISISETGHWIDVNSVRVGERSTVRVRRSRTMDTPGALPEAMREAMTPRARADAASRVAAALPLTLERVTDAAEALDDRVAEAWILESSRDGSRMSPVTASELARLADAGVPARVIDVVVALGYPAKFQVAMGAEGLGEVSEVAGVRGGGGAFAGSRMNGDVFGYSLYGGFPRCYTYSCFLYYSYAPGLYHADSRFYGLAGWNTYGGWGMYPGWGYGGPVTVIVRPSPPGGGGSPSGGRVVKGRGYTPTGPTSGSPVQPRAEAPRSSGGAASAKGSSSSGSTEKTRTAKPRNP